MVVFWISLYVHSYDHLRMKHRTHHIGGQIIAIAPVYEHVLMRHLLLRRSWKATEPSPIGGKTFSKLIEPLTNLHIGPFRATNSYITESSQYNPAIGNVATNAKIRDDRVFD